MTAWFRSIWSVVTSVLALPTLLLRLREIWYGATEITVTKVKETYEAIMAYFPRKK